MDDPPITRDPNPDEIAARAAAIRAGWTEDEATARQRVPLADLLADLADPDVTPTPPRSLRVLPRGGTPSELKDWDFSALGQEFGYPHTHVGKAHFCMRGPWRFTAATLDRIRAAVEARRVPARLRKQLAAIVRPKRRRRDKTKAR